MPVTTDISTSLNGEDVNDNKPKQVTHCKNCGQPKEVDLNEMEMYWYPVTDSSQKYTWVGPTSMTNDDGRVDDSIPDTYCINKYKYPSYKRRDMQPLVLDLDNPDTYKWIQDNTYDGHATLSLHRSTSLTLCDMKYDKQPRFNNKTPTLDEKFYYKVKYVVDQVYGYGNDAWSTAEWTFLHNVCLSEYGTVYNLSPVKVPNNIVLDDDGEWKTVNGVVGSEIHLWSGCGATIHTTPMEDDKGPISDSGGGILVGMASFLFGLALTILSVPAAIEAAFAVGMYALERTYQNTSNDVCCSASITLTTGACANIMSNGKDSDQYVGTGKKMLLRRRSDYPRTHLFSHGPDEETNTGSGITIWHEVGQQIEMDASWSGQKAMWDMYIHVDGPFTLSKDENGNDVETRVDVESLISIKE